MIAGSHKETPGIEPWIQAHTFCPTDIRLFNKTGYAMWLINRAAALQWDSTSIYIEKTEMWESVRGAETNVGPEEQWKKGIIGATGALLQREAGHCKEL